MCAWRIQGCGPARDIRITLVKSSCGGNMHGCMLVVNTSAKERYIFTKEPYISAEN